MARKKVSLVIITGAFCIMILFLFTLNKVNNYKKETEISHDVLRSLELNTVITDVAIGRQLEIKIYGIMNWVRVGGCRLNLKKNQRAPKEYYLKGDSIVKDANSSLFIIKRGNEEFNWVIE